MMDGDCYFFSGESNSATKLSSSKEHGGYIYELLKRGMMFKDILDFSASINPLGPPSTVTSPLSEVQSFSPSPNLFLSYPDPEAEDLRYQISNSYGIEPDFIIAGNGSTELIYLVVRALRPRKVLIPQPTFSEYERATKCAGIKEIMTFYLKEEDNFNLPVKDFINQMRSNLGVQDMVFICNPNNPTGGLIKRDELLEIAEVAERLKCYLVVDEAFMDFIPEESVIKEVLNNSFLIVLRSMTKFYGLAGLRLGYGVMNTGVCKRLMEYKEPWTVNTIAQMVGIICLKDSNFRTQSINLISQWKAHIEELFKIHRISYIPSSVNFYLFSLRLESNSCSLIPFLKKKGILIRDCSNFKGLQLTGHGRHWFRIAVRRPEENERLFNEMTRYLVER